MTPLTLPPVILSECNQSRDLDLSYAVASRYQPERAGFRDPARSRKRVEGPLFVSRQRRRFTIHREEVLSGLLPLPALPLEP